MTEDTPVTNDEILNVDEPVQENLPEDLGDMEEPAPTEPEVENSSGPNPRR